MLDAAFRQHDDANSRQKYQAQHHIGKTAPSKYNRYTIETGKDIRRLAGRAED
ncbi:MAG TPA: hypothetical protein VGM09_12180 [Bradyrhizobium sp.]